jgi:hypothetical protein
MAGPTVIKHLVSTPFAAPFDAAFLSSAVRGRACVPKELTGITFFPTPTTVTEKEFNDQVRFIVDDA